MSVGHARLGQNKSNYRRKAESASVCSTGHKGVGGQACRRGILMCIYLFVVQFLDVNRKYVIAVTVRGRSSDGS